MADYLPRSPHVGNLSAPIIGLPDQLCKHGQQGKGSLMFVVRIDRADEAPDYKVFSRREDAEERFRAARFFVQKDELLSVAWFKVDTVEARDAVEAVRKADGKRVQLLGKEPTVPQIDLSALFSKGPPG